MDKYIGFGIDSKKTVTCVIQKGKPLTNRRRPLKTLPISMIFINCFHYRAYEVHAFVELADNELLGCRPVVGVNSLKGGHLGVIRVRLSALLVSWWGWSESFCRFMWNDHLKSS